MSAHNPHLFVFGPGYSASPIMARAMKNGWKVSASHRDASKADALQSMGVTPVPLEPTALQPALKTSTHILTSVAPGPGGDPILPLITTLADTLDSLRWVGYLSSTNVYGNHDGGWVDEGTPAAPSLDRGKRRIDAELSWNDFSNKSKSALHIFRLAGIYGPGRNAVRTVLDGRAKRIFKEGQLFSRIHLADIEESVWRAMNSSLPSRIFNLADDAPAPPQDIIEKAALAVGKPVPPLIPFEDADLSPMARSFYEESKRVRNDRVKTDLSFKLKYPSFDSALDDLIAFETGSKT